MVVKPISRTVRKLRSDLTVVQDALQRILHRCREGSRQRKDRLHWLEARFTEFEGLTERELLELGAPAEVNGETLLIIPADKHEAVQLLLHYYPGRRELILFYISIDGDEEEGAPKSKARKKEVGHETPSTGGQVRRIPDDHGQIGGKALQREPPAVHRTQPAAARTNWGESHGR